MSRLLPSPDCADLVFGDAFALDDAGQVALEDYARVLTHASRAEIIVDGTDVSGVHLCGVEAGIHQAARQDVEDFASDLLRHGEGLGWT